MTKAEESADRVWGRMLPAERDIMRRMLGFKPWGDPRLPASIYTGEAKKESTQSSEPMLYLLVDCGQAARGQAYEVADIRSHPAHAPWMDSHIGKSYVCMGSDGFTVQVLDSASGAMWDFPPQALGTR